MSTTLAAPIGVTQTKPKQLSKASKYFRYALAGASCASLTHAVLVPMDVVKTRLQVQAGVFEGASQAFNKIYAKEGAKALFVGFSPTIAGYCLQGAAKFGFYEMLKDLSVNVVGRDIAAQYSLPIYLASAGVAETLATILLTPFEAIRIRMLSRQVASGEVFNMTAKAARIYKSEGWNGFYKGLTPVLLKQVPYTMVQLATFTKSVDFTYGTLVPFFKPGARKEDLNVYAQLGISLSCGVFAGVLSAIVSHPPDTILSRINMTKSAEELERERLHGKPSNIQAISRIVKELGFKGLWLGIGMRCVFVGTLSAGMFLIYDSVKVAFGLPTTSGLNSKNH